MSKQLACELSQMQQLPGSPGQLSKHVNGIEFVQVVHELGQQYPLCCAFARERLAAASVNPIPIAVVVASLPRKRRRVDRSSRTSGVVISTLHLLL